MTDVLVLHAYSRANHGDGLLVDATLALLEEAGIQRSQCTVVARDAHSFADLPNVVQVPLTRSAQIASVAGHQTENRIRALADRASLVIGVGGGYLRAGRPSEALKTNVVHVGQLAAAASSRTPAVYLPQSVGPLRGPVGSRVRGHLGRIDHLFLRDDISVREVGSRRGTERCPDLALLELGRSEGSRREATTAPSVVVLRALPRPRRYLARLSRLLELCDKRILALQSSGFGNDDRKFAQSLGEPQPSPLRAVLQAYPGAVVTSVRLHGALEAIATGSPAIHLSYERKGWGAFGDLGLPEYVHNAWSFDPHLVAQQIRRLQSDPTHYWLRVDRAIPRLVEARAKLVDVLRSTAG